MSRVSRAASVICTLMFLVVMSQPAPAKQATTAKPAAAPAKPAAQPAAGQPAATQPTPAPEVVALTDSGWPRIITSGQIRITVYQPQIDSFDGFRLSGRAAVAVAETTGATPVYGIVQVSADAHIDKDDRLVTFTKLTVKSASFPGASERGQQWALLIQSRAAARLNTMALERFEAALAVSAAERKADAIAVKNDPPVVLISTVPSMLILIDGEPAYRQVTGTSLMRVLNTRPLLLRDGGGKHYLKIFDGWMESPSLTGAWTVASKVPADLEKALQMAVNEKVVDMLVGGDPSDPKTAPSLKKQPPHIFVETKPAELLVFEGEPEFTPVEGTALMYAENTTGHLFVHAQDQQAYILISGRWFSGPSALKGPWSFVPGEKLPKDFPLIPDESPKENVKASIPGTDQAQEAVVANSVPQTAQVKRSEAKFVPAFDGAPKLAPIEETNLQYVANTASPIIALGSPSEYFGVQNGVWFVANSLSGPWLVATTVPSEIVCDPCELTAALRDLRENLRLEPGSGRRRLHPGLYGRVREQRVWVYGTGYVYPPWIGTYWYGPPYTYGFGVSMAFTPWGGWHMGFGYGWTWGAATVAIGWGWGPYPWWGGYGWGGYYPYVYRPGYGAVWGPRGGYGAWGPGYWGGTTGNMYHRWGSTTAVTRRSGGYNAWTEIAGPPQPAAHITPRTGVAAAGQRGVVGNVYRALTRQEAAEPQ